MHTNSGAGAGTGAHTQQPDRRGGLQTRNKALVIVGVVASVLICGGLLVFFLLRYIRIHRANPKYIPGQKLKQRWRTWNPGHSGSPYSTSLNDRASMLSLPIARTASPTSAQQSSRASRILMLGSEGDLGLRSGESASAIARNTSVRSVQTLPAYSATARESEKILGREGERAFVDTVVEFPETAEEEETRRDEEMESLYQIRRARREERAEREHRRQLRREARSRGDTTTLQELRLAELNNSSRAAGNPTNSATTLIEEHESRERGRRVSSVDYAAVGIARHDGSRVRASSNGSDRALLDSAASIGTGGRDRSSSGPRAPFAITDHGRDRSTSSLRFTADYSDDDHSSGFEVVLTPRDSRRPSGTRLRTASSADRDNNAAQQSADPPQYEDITLSRTQEANVPEDDAPPYESPRRTDPPIQQSFGPLPAIEVTPFSPILELDGTDESGDSQALR